MKRTIAALSLTLFISVAFIGCSGPEAPKNTPSGDSMMKDDGMMKDGMKDGMKGGMKGDGMMKDDAMMKDDKMMKDAPK